VSELEFGWRMATWPTDRTPGTVLVEQIEEHLRRIEGAFASVWIQDHLSPEHPWCDPSWDSLEAWSSLAHLAAAFPAYQYGHIVLANSFRNPALLAKMAATTQLLTRGRFVLGLGAGWHEAEYRGYGFEYPEPKVRIGQLAEAAQLIKTLWTEEPPVSFEGKYYRLEQAWANPRPDPAPPIMIGGGGEQLTLRAVARWADWYSVPGLHLDVVRHKLGVLREHCAAVGRDYDSIVKVGSNSCIAVAPTREAAQRIAEASPFYNPDSALYGEPDDVADQLRRHVELGISKIVLRFADFPRLDGIMLFAERVAPAFR
jgi:alkanesulfonate monooxygenase SsuD/methylene tetrahydromethanopterin reductase-like flavin-dependent oxidoreductase (luciferase family)